MKPSRWAPILLAAGIPACDVSVTVGYNDDALLPGASCPADAPVRACSTEACVVSELGAAQIGKETLAVDDESIFFITDGDVLSRMPIGGGEVVALADVSGNLERMVLDSDYVYWTVFDGTVLKVPKGGGETTTVATIFGHPVPIALHENDLYVAMTDSGEIATIDKVSGATTSLAGEGTPIDLAIDSEHVYWIDQGEPDGATGRLVRAPLGDLTGAEEVLSGLTEPLVLGVTPDAILWATYDKVFRLPRAGGDPQELDVPFGEPKGVTELDGIVYAAGETGLFRVQLDGGDPLALDGRGFTGIALACDGLYGVGWFLPILVRYGP
ncbi:MAG: hypothetical protein JNK04_08345 [Myxococcales bacterium]|nr:hypothetical protein [Myxococcales bacterium]